ncbi:DUF4232 domain-containing protein [Streptomyces sp. NPDC059037]|uniref:DUF4232 domain-containing protein n=1 Tax=Streptomyces sp. NPDC059037 TaxID=3346710 RepID=UPI003678719F
MRTNRIRAAVLAAAATTLALGLTACGSGSGSDGDSAKADTGKSVGTSVDGSKGSEDSGHSDSSDGSDDSEAAGTPGSTVQADNGNAGSGAATTAQQPCKGDEMSYSVLHRFPAEEGEHLLITATNADTKPCWVTSYPSVMLGDTTTVLPHSSKDADGAAKVTVKPGGKVYSAVSLFTDGDKTNTSSKLSLALRDQTGDSGPGYDNEAFDGKGAPSEFTWDTAEVTNWNTEKPYDF